MVLLTLPFAWLIDRKGVREGNGAVYDERATDGGRRVARILLGAVLILAPFLAIAVALS